MCSFKIILRILSYNRNKNLRGINCLLHLQYQITSYTGVISELFQNGISIIGIMKRTVWFMLIFFLKKPTWALKMTCFCSQCMPKVFYIILSNYFLLYFKLIFTTAVKALVIHASLIWTLHNWHIKILSKDLLAQSCSEVSFYSVFLSFKDVPVF